MYYPSVALECALNTRSYADRFYPEGITCTLNHIKIFTWRSSIFTYSLLRQIPINDNSSITQRQKKNVYFLPWKLNTCSPIAITVLTLVHCIQCSNSIILPLFSQNWTDRQMDRPLTSEHTRARAPLNKKLLLLIETCPIHTACCHKV